MTSTLSGSPRPADATSPPHTAFAPEWVAERLRCALACDADADGLEARFNGSLVHQLRLGEATIIHAGHVTQGEVVVRAVRDGRQGIAATTDLSDHGVRACAKQAVDQARVAPPSRDLSALPEPNNRVAPLDWALDPRVLELDTATKASWLRPAIEAHRRDGLALAGRFNTGRVVMAVQSTTGVEVHHQGSLVDLALSSLEHPAGHGASSTRTVLDATIDQDRVHALQRLVRDECGRAHDPVSIEPGAWDVVLEASALSRILNWLASIGFSSRSVEDGLSFAAGRQGQQVTGSQVNLVDDGAMPHRVGVPVPFDAEGQPRRRVSLLEGGHVRDLVHSTATARRAGCASTGHANPMGIFSAGGASPSHLHLEPGEAKLDELIGQVERGLYITRLHYVNGMLEPRRAVMTGLMRDAAFLIVDGRLARAVTPLRFTDSILEAFSRIPERGVGRHCAPEPGGYRWESCVVCPPVLVRQLQFTSGR